MTDKTKKKIENDGSYILSNIEDVEAKGKFNFCIIKYRHTKKDENVAISLPFHDEMVGDILQNIKLLSEKEVSLIPYDPLHENKPEEYQYLALDKVKIKFDEICSLVKDKQAFNKKSEPDAGSVNLLFSEFTYNDKYYYLGALQVPANRLLKGKKAYQIEECEDNKTLDKTVYDTYEMGKKQLFHEEAKLKKIDIKHFIALKFYTDFIIEINEEYSVVYILNRRNFDSVFNYTEDLKQLVEENVSTIEKWSFLDNAKFITDKISSRYVYEPLSKIISDSDYLDSMKKIKDSELKKRLLKKSNNAFTEKDFEGNKLKVTKDNSKKIIKMISKGFKYNFFKDIGEE